MVIAGDNPFETNNGLTEITDKPNGIIVDVTTGDESIPALLNNERLVMVKIDVEGHEPYVLQGLSKTIEQHKPLIFWEAFTQETVDESKKILESLGYSNFYHLTKDRFKSKRMNKLFRSFGRSTYLFELDESPSFGGMNLASFEKLSTPKS